jgi:ubiquinone/menaquinone biosynthesis C-methylase UbiE
MSLAQKWCLLKARTKQRRLNPFLVEAGSVLDIGCGNGALAHRLKQEGISIQCVDICDKSRFDDVRPIVYDGKNLPFEDQQFQTVLLITMLHHTPNPERILGEAMRVGQRIVVMEDVYSNPLQKQLTYFVDSLVNWEFRGHPHTNKTDEGWKACFAALGWTVKDYRKDRFLFLFTQTIYQLEQMDTAIKGI